MKKVMPPQQQQNSEGCWGRGHGIGLAAFGMVRSLGFE